MKDEREEAGVLVVARRALGLSRMRTVLRAGEAEGRVVTSVVIFSAAWGREGEVRVVVPGAGVGEVVCGWAGSGWGAAAGVRTGGPRMGKVDGPLAGTVERAVGCCCGANDLVGGGATLSEGAGAKRLVRPSTNANRFCCARRARSKPYDCQYRPRRLYIARLYAVLGYSTYTTSPCLCLPKLPVAHPAHQHDSHVFLILCSIAIVHYVLISSSCVLQSAAIAKERVQVADDEPGGCSIEDACEQGKRRLGWQPDVWLEERWNAITVGHSEGIGM